MKRNSFYLTLFFLLVFCPTQTIAGSCRSITNEINDDVTRYEGRLKNQNLRWMNLEWIQQQLGSAGSKSRTGKNTEYRWHCEMDGSYLIAVVDDNGNYKRVKGQYNSDEGSGYFSASIPATATQSKATETDTKPAVTETTVTTPATPTLGDNLIKYNEHYKTNFQTYAEIEEDMIKKISLYYFNLRRCAPGSYEYPGPAFPDFLFYTATISTPKDGTCPVKISYEIPEIGKIDLKCNYQSQSLALFTEEEATNQARNGMKMNSENPSAIQIINKNECKRYVGGVL